jgi:hypothetical protein
MKIIGFLLCICFGLLSFTAEQDEHIQFICKRKQTSTNRCHYNFKVDGAKFRYIDIGCKIKKQSELIEKVKSGDIALARDWEIECGGESSKN